MKAQFQRVWIFGGFIALFLLLVGNAAVVHLRVKNQYQKRDLLLQSQQALATFDRTITLLLNAETGQRGYLLTNDPAYLTPYNESIQEIQPTLDSLQKLTRLSPTQQARIPVLRELVGQKLDELNETIVLRRSHQIDQEKSLVFSGRGKVIMDNIRVVLKDMQREENASIAEGLVDIRASVERTTASLYWTYAVALLGVAILAYFTLRQIREREQYAALAGEREKWFRVTLSSIGDAVIATDPNGTVTFLNRVAEQITGYSMEEGAGKPISSIFPIFNEQTQQPVENPVAKVIEEGNIVGLANHTVLRNRSGKLIPIEDSAAPIRDEENHLSGVVMVFRDTSQSREADQLLRRAEKLAAAGRLASTVAHEINNPLEAVCNLIYIVKHTSNLPPEAMEHLKLAEQQLDRVSHVTRQTLGFYRETTEPVPVSLPALVDSVLDLFKNKLASKKIAVDRDFHLGPPIVGFPGELKQLVANLISNAADAVSHEGRISVTVRQEKSGIEIHISDDGPGIHPENISRIFEPFFTTKKEVGTGLGLWIVKNITERHGGSIRAVSPRTDVG
ncbi:MAG TPA: CHASE3 domain-containing protein, partial [Terriglobales bacterium]|nr:CHASE3 domain-containing protein [Terriglobales bacterium]